MSLRDLASDLPYATCLPHLGRCVARRRRTSAILQRRNDLPCTHPRAARTKKRPCESLFAEATQHRERAPALPRSGGACTGEIEAKDGLPSADRNNKATLLLTGPFRTAKSSAKDLTPLVLKLQYAKYHDALRAPWRISPAKTLSRGLFLSIYTCGRYHRVLAWILT